MKSPAIYATLLLFAAAIVTPALAKDGVVATVHTLIPADAAEGSQVEVSWSLVFPELDNQPFNASKVFIKLIGSDGAETEAFSHDGAHMDGNYDAKATIPVGGVVEVKIGVAGTVTYPDGRSKRGDRIFPLANDPIEN